MAKKQEVELNSCLMELNLTTAHKRYTELAEQAESESLSYQAFLLSVLEAECQTRRIRRIDRRLRESRLPLEKNLETFELKRLPQKVNRQIKTLMMGDFINHNENVLIFGNPGSGKTHLVCALGQELIRQDKRIYFSTCALLLQELLLAKKDLHLPRLLKKLSRFDAIIIDDIGYVQQEKEEMEVLFTLLAERYEQGSVMITSNLPFSKWEKIFKDPMMTAAAVDRIVHHSVILELNIPSYRIITAKNRKLKEAS
ncbi:DNA replication protein DnaC [bacterium BMS3Bbin07]|nr:DNA replication protein DnaC [bacterium BMS3Bbin07]HDH08355.1 AAA family ATPase [Gammaproteobacteria bacterium]